MTATTTQTAQPTTTDRFELDQARAVQLLKAYSYDKFRDYTRDDAAILVATALEENVITGPFTKPARNHQQIALPWDAVVAESGLYGSDMHRRSVAAATTPSGIVGGLRILKSAVHILNQIGYVAGLALEKKDIRGEFIHADNGGVAVYEVRTGAQPPEPTDGDDEISLDPAPWEDLTELITPGHISPVRALAAFNAYTLATQEWHLTEEYPEPYRIRHGYAVLELGANPAFQLVSAAEAATNPAAFPVTRWTDEDPGEC